MPSAEQAGEATEPVHTAGRPPILEVRDLVTGYGDLQVLREFNLSLQPGSVELLLGRNGAGKSTVVQAIAGLIPTWAGSITIAGNEVSRLPAHRRVPEGIAAVLEGRRIFRRRTVRENLIVGGHGLDRALRAERIEGVLEQMPLLAEMLDRVAGGLSGGQQQMLAIGQALMPDPQVLILDEPSAGLAPAVVDTVLEQIRAMRERGKAVLLVEQIVDRVIGVADHVTVMDDGAVVIDGEPGIVADVRVLQSAYFGQLGDNHI